MPTYRCQHIYANIYVCQRELNKQDSHHPNKDDAAKMAKNTKLYAGSQFQ